MFDVKTAEREIGGRSFSFETGRMARQAHGSVVVRYGETMVLVAATTGKAREGIDFFPLTMDYREKTGSAGKIPGGFFKREGRPTTKEILTMRMMDRPIRPLFPDGFKAEVQIQAFVLSADPELDPDMAAINGASAALNISSIPFNGPVGAVRVGLIEDELVINPTHTERTQSSLDLVVVGTANAVTMVECGARELSEETMLEAIALAHESIKAICETQNALREQVGNEKFEFVPPQVNADLVGELSEKYAGAVREAFGNDGKHAKGAALAAVRAEAIEHFVPGEEKDILKVKEVKNLFHDLESNIVRAMALEGTRIDGRSPTDIRPIECGVGFLPRAHGSALFTRGETQALVTATLGTADDEQIIDGLQDEVRRKFLLHYNFPPFSVRETRPIRGPGRREIGHGALAERSVEPVLPDNETFPYTLRVVSDILESNGSSSMATVCGATLALMDAGVKIRRPVAGIAMGLVTEGDQNQILSDILGTEDHCGDMDFKVAGTQNGITALQMDIKMTGVPQDVMAKALEQARVGRLSILRSMLKALSRPRAEISMHAPKMFLVKIPRDKIGMLIGPGGKNIRRLQEETGSTINVEDDGTVKIFAVNTTGAEAARDEVEMLGKEAKMDEIYKGRVVSMKDFGVFVELWPGTEALCHISELSAEYLDKVEDAVEIGEEIDVKVISIDDSGRVKVSRKEVLAPGSGSEGGGAARPNNRRSGGDRGRGGDRGGRGGDRGGRSGDRGGRGGDRGGRGGDRGGRSGGSRGGSRGGNR